MVVRAFTRVFTTLCLAAVSLVLLTTAALASECSNELRREEQNSTYLPECRAYELVTPTEKNGSDIVGKGFITEASSDGERVTFGALAGFGDTEGSGIGGFQQYVASRDNGSWTSHGITPLPASDAYQFLTGSTWVRTFSEDLSNSVVESYDLPAKTDDISHEVNNYRETTASRALQTITTDPAGNNVGFFSLVNSLRATSPDLSVVTFETTSDLTPEATGSAHKLYEWREGQLKLAGILPNGAVPAGGSGAVASGQLNDRGNQHMVSPDGSSVLFLSPASGSKRQLYVRRNGTSTARVSESEASSPVAEPEDVVPQWISQDGTKILFTSHDALADSDPGGEGEGLYLYTESPSPTTETNLTFIARAKPAGSTYSNQVVLGASPDFKRFYIETTTPTATFAQPGIYLWDEGVLHTVTQVTSLGDVIPIAYSVESPTGEEVQASADARQLAFLSRYNLTEDASTYGIAKMYVYNEDTETFRCVSCLGGKPESFPGATIEPDASHEAIGISITINPRLMTADGRHVFFSSSEALVPQDVNGLDDAYEYDTATEELSLLSSGVGQNGAWYVASGASGRDAFIVTRDSLLTSDIDSLVDVYDVRVDGGVPQPQPQTGGCVGDECQGVPSAAPSFNTASGFSGLGNIAPAKSTVVKRKALTRAQRLTRALKACTRKSRKARKRCRARARHRYAVHKAGKSTHYRAHR